MPRRTPVREIQSEEIPSSPLRRSSRISNASPVPTSAPTRVLTRRNSATEIPSASTPTRVTRSRRSSFSQEQEKAEEVDKVTKTTRTRRGSLSQNDDNKTEEETTTKRKTRGSSVTKEETPEVKKPATRRRKSVSEDEEKGEENETVKRFTRARSGSLTKKTDLEDLKPKSNFESSEKLASPTKKDPEIAKTLESIEEVNKESDSPQTKIPVVRIKRIDVAKVDLDLSVINETSLTEEDSTTQAEDISSVSQQKEETEDSSMEKEPKPATPSKKEEKTKDDESLKLEDTKSNEEKLIILEKSSVIKENPSAVVRKDSEVSDASLSEASFHLQLSSSVIETSFTHEVKENSPSNKENVSPKKKAPIVETDECEPMDVDVSLSCISPSPAKSHRKSLSKSLKIDDVGKELEIAANATDEIANFLTEEIKFAGKNPSVTSKLHESIEDAKATGENRKYYRLSLKKNRESVSPKVNGTSEDKSTREVTVKNEEAKDTSTIVSEEKKEKLMSDADEEPEKEDIVPSKEREESPKKIVNLSMERQESEATGKDKKDIVNEESESASAVEVEYASPIEEIGDSDIEPLELEETEKEVEDSASAILPKESPEEHESPQIENEETSQEIQASSLNKSLNQSVVGESPEDGIDSLKEQVLEDQGTKEEQMKEIEEIHELHVTKEEETSLEATTIRESKEASIASSSPTKSLNESKPAESPEDTQIVEEQMVETEDVQELSQKKSEEKVEIEEMKTSTEKTTAEDKEDVEKEDTVEPNDVEDDVSTEETAAEDKKVEEFPTSTEKEDTEAISTVEEFPKNTEKEDTEAISTVEPNEVEDDVSNEENGSTVDDEEEEDTSMLYNTSGDEAVFDEDEERTMDKKIDSKKSKIEKDKSTPEIVIVSEDEEDSKESRNEEVRGKTPEKEDKVIVSNQRRSEDSRESRNEDVKGKTPEKEDKIIVSNQRRSSFTMQENLKAVDGHNLREQIHKVVDMFCAGIKNKDVKLNVSLEYTGQFSDDSQNEGSKTDVFDVSLAAIAAEDQQVEKASKNEKGSKRRKICHEEEQHQLSNEDSLLKDTTEDEEPAEISLSESKRKKKKRKVYMEVDDDSSPTMADISPSKKQKKLPNTPYKTPNSKEKTPISDEESEEDVNINEKSHEQVVPKREGKEERKSNSVSPCKLDFENLPSYLQTADESQELDDTWAPSEDEDIESSGSSSNEFNETTEIQEDLEKLKDLNEDISNIENKIKKDEASVKLLFSGASDSSDEVLEVENEEVLEEENEDEGLKQKGKKKRKLFHLSDYDISKAMKMDLESSTEETKKEQKSRKKKKKNKVPIEENDLPQMSEHIVKDNDKNAKKKKKKRSRGVQNIISSTSEDEDVADAQEFGPDILFSKKLPAEDAEVDTDYFKPSASVKPLNIKTKLSKIKPSVASGTSEWDVEIIS